MIDFYIAVCSIVGLMIVSCAAVMIIKYDYL